MELNWICRCGDELLMLPSIIYGLLYSMVPLILMIVGTRFPSEPFIYASLISIVLLILLRALGVLRKETDFFLVFCIGLSLLLQNTLITDFLVGTDIHGEYYFSYTGLKTGWDISIPHPYNSSMLISLIIPTISNTLGIPLEAIFKVFLPICLACVPVVCYYIFRKVFTDIISFLASIFLISVPTFFLEITGIGKQMVGELFLVLTLYVLFFSKFSNVKRGVLALILGGLTIMTHYSMGSILILYISGATLILLGIKYIFKQDIQISLKPIIPVLLACFLIGGVYYSIVSQGVIVKILEAHALNQVIKVQAMLNIDSTSTELKRDAVEKDTVVPATLGEQWVKFYKEEGQAIKTIVTPSPELKSPLDKYLFNLEPTLKGAVGLDFMAQGPLGKTFRVLQYLTQLLMILGLLYFILTKKYKENWVYTAFFVTGWGILGLTLFFPGFSAILNASRFYHIALLFIAPSCILIFSSKPQLSLIILIPYLIFTSGIPYEAFKVNTANTLSLPYSYGLSGYRMDLTTINSDNDNLIRTYMEDNNFKSKVTYSDQWGFTFLADKFAENVRYLPSNCTDIPSDSYIFLRERNVDTTTVCYWLGIGKRINIDFKECKLDKELEKRSVIKECGSARLYGPRLKDN